MKRALFAIVAPIVTAATIASTIVGCKGRPRAWDVGNEVESPRSHEAFVAEIDLTSGAPEQGHKGVLSLPSKTTFDALVAALHRAKDHKGLRGVFVAFGAIELGWARSHELGDALAAIRAAKIPVICHADAWGNDTYSAAARGCDVIAMSPAGEVEATGPSATLPYAHELLVDKLHAQIDMLQVGKFKGAEEPLTRDGPSDEYRASMESMLSAVTASYHESTKSHAGSDSIGKGPFAGEEAKKAGLVDELIDRTAARELAKAKSGGVGVEVMFGSGAASDRPILLELVRALSEPTREATSGPHIRVLRLTGEISLEKTSGPLDRGGGIVARQVVERAHALADDPNVKAVVLRIDSPGGSALGSDLAWIALKALRDKKPLVTSVGELAASGGYYMASASTKIFAEPESIVGSIGVVGGKVSFSGTLAQVGIHTAVFGDVRAAKMASITEPWDDAIRARLQGSMETIYALFLQRVSSGRGLPVEAFANAVEGRVFGGVRAKELHLVDELGGLQAAIDDARSLAGLSDTTPVVADEPSGLLGQLSLDDEARAVGVRAFGLDFQGPREIAAMQRWLLAFVAVSEGEGYATMLPSALVVR